jgi:uncharacterized protein (TIGR00730 family)
MTELDDDASILNPPLAYRNREFLDSDQARPIRILAEYLQPLEVFEEEKISDTIVFFGSARVTEDGPHARYYAEARELARLVTLWSQSLASPAQRFIVCSGGGPGIMEAANRGACDAHGRSIGLNIGLPHEQRPNPYITRRLSFQFHYFFMRKLWLAYMARAIVAFPGGFGTLDEVFELLTLVQTRKLERPLVVLLYGRAYWNEIVDFEALARHGMIANEDLALIRYADQPHEALEILHASLVEGPQAAAPAIAKSVRPNNHSAR